MRKLISTVVAIIVLTEVHGRTPGWFYSVRGGTGLLPNMMYPDALTSVVHGCAELDKETDDKQVQHTKLSGITKKVVKTASSVSHERVDNELFEKLNDKIFHHQQDHDDRSDNDEEKPAVAKISYGAREFLLEDDMYE
ncbi:hypothetical protein QTG54_011098 [Skeletonema marinoi]|uniref:Uncharacterized protein n=1 Tax=Skeletonema marinoi TaxID=267567 RepID=A0AAD8Y2H5_9STRA|nr:hypothetical protein QTG54_011098 [Skeletonema marinoi]